MRIDSRSAGWIGAALALIASAAACGGEDETPTPAGAAGTGGAAGAEAGKDVVAEGSGGKGGDGGAAGSEAGAGAGGAAGGGGSDAGDAGKPSWALFTGSNFATAAELAVVDLTQGTVAGHLALADQDSFATASGGRGFVLGRGKGSVSILDTAKPWTVAKTVDVNGPDAGDGSYLSNPYAVVVAAGPSKAYVVRYAKNDLLVIDVAAGTVTGQVDLKPHLDPADPDGLVDAVDGAYDPQTKRAYFVLQRIDQFDFGPAPDYVGKCLPFRGVVVALDATNDQPVDLNGSAPGTAAPLLGDDPNAIVADFAAGRLVVLDTGCYVPADGGADGGPAQRKGRGVEAVDLATGTSKWLVQTSDTDRLSGIVWAGPKQAWVQKGDDWVAWDPTQASLGAKEPGLPLVPFWDGKGAVVGLASAKPADGGAEAGAVVSVVAFDPAAKKTTVVAADLFADASMKPYSSAAVK